MNAEPTPSWPNWVHSIIADTTAAAKPTSLEVATCAATNQKTKPRPIAATRPESMPSALPVIEPELFRPDVRRRAGVRSCPWQPA